MLDVHRVRLSSQEERFVSGAGRRYSLRASTELNCAAPSSSVTHRNAKLGDQLRARAPSKAAYVRVKREATNLARGAISAEAFYDIFAATYGDSEDSVALLLEMADLLPDDAVCRDLMAACGFSGASDAGNTRQLGPSQHAADLEPAGARPLSEQYVVRTTRAEVVGDESRTSNDAARTERHEFANGDGFEGDPNEALERLGISPELIGGASRDATRRPKRHKKERTGTATASSTPTRPNVLYWIRQDFRLHDNPALYHAAKYAADCGSRVFCVYIHSPAELGVVPWQGSAWAPGGASCVWTEAALLSMDRDLQARFGGGAQIIVGRGPSRDVLMHLSDQLHAGALFFNRRYEPATEAADAHTASALRAHGIEVQSFNALLLHEPKDVTVDMARWKGHFGTLMPFYAACERRGGFVGKAQGRVPTPETLPGADEALPLPARDGLSVSDLGLYTPARRRDGSVVDWGAALRQHWDISESAALALLRAFNYGGALSRYESQRGRADGSSVSRLSPYLHFGMISPRLMMDEVAKARGRELSKTFWRRLVWRDLAYWQLHHWPAMSTRSIRPAYDDQAWNFNPQWLSAWQRGVTGFPLVDAGMRELWQTGYMQQNVRMVVACFLTEYLNMHWVHGARWFHDTLFDADIAINSMMWQNAGKSGLDQWNFTVTPVSKASDPSGSYIKRWVPELAKLQSVHMHAPWEAPNDELARAGVRLGETYPERLVTEEWGTLRSKNLAAIRNARAKHTGMQDGNGYDLIEVPHGAASGVKGQRVRVFTVPRLREAEGRAQGTGRGKARAAASGRRRATARGGRAGKSKQQTLEAMLGKER